LSCEGGGGASLPSPVRMHIRLVAALLTFAATLAAHLFVARWLVHVAPRLGRHRRWAIAALVVPCAVTGLARYAMVAWPSDGLERLSAFGLVESVIVVGWAILLAVMGLLLRLVEGFRGARDETPPASVARRQILEQVGGTLALGASSALIGWGMVRGRHAYEIEEVPVRVPGLPRALDGYTIAQISDIHTGVFVGDRELAEGLSLVRAVRPDMVVATGDLVDFDARYAVKVAGALGRLQARDGVFAVLGNHDYYADAKAVATAMRSAGIRLLLNEGITVRPNDGGGFALLGVDDLWAQRWHGAGPDLDRAIAMVSPDAPRVLLAHQPAYFDIAAGHVALQLSGHTHGGQINPGFHPAEFFIRYLVGRYEQRGSTLWVNRGFGVAGPPARIGTPPEVTKIVLVAA
jgi:predicted MPP superfamily phosphohydrolase